MESTDFTSGIRDALDRGNHAEALAAAIQAVATHPESAQAYRLLAAAQRAAGDQATALASIDRAIALAPDDADAHFERAGLLLGEHQVDAAQAALARSIGLDPNLFGAYVLQAQLALGRGDLDDAERLRRLASRIAPEHPQLAAIEGTLALRRNDPARAQSVLANALQQHPDNAQVAYALGFVYMAQGHLAFAEQVFRNVLAGHPNAVNLHALIADLVRLQGRPSQALQEIAPLLDDPARATPGLRRIAGELELLAGHPERALPWLRDALGAQPDDRRTLSALMETWRRLGDREQARATLDAALATSPQVEHLWQARLAVESELQPAQAVLDRWLMAMPRAIAALEARMALHDRAGEPAAAEIVAKQIAALEPGRSSAEFRLLDGLLERDPPAAIARAEQLIEHAPAGDGRQLLSGWLALAHDRAGQPAAAVALWSRLQADVAGARLPLWQPSAATPARWPDFGEIAPDAPPIAWLWGPPGSAVEAVASVLAAVTPAFRADRFGPSPPADAFQRFQTVADLQSQALPPGELVAQWQAGLMARGIRDGQVIDWLPYWDNLLLLALRVHAPQGMVLVAMRDPRDLLLDWLAFGATPPLALATPMAAADWLAQVLAQVATVQEQSLYPLQLLKVDSIHDDPAALASAIGIPAPPESSIAPARRRFPAGHWRVYADALAGPFAALTPVARRLGYE